MSHQNTSRLQGRGPEARRSRYRGRGSVRGTSCCNRVGKGWRGDTLHCDKCERIWMPSEEYRRSYRGTQRGGNRGRNRGGNRGGYRGGNCRGYRGKGRGSMRGTSCCNRVGKPWRGDALKCDKCDRIWMPSEVYRRSYRGSQRGGNRGYRRGNRGGDSRGCTKSIKN